MGKFRDLTGQTKNRLTAIQDTGRRKKCGNAIWIFQCSCDGREVEIPSADFIAGHTTSCGCIRRETRVATHFKHGHRARFEQSPTYYSWTSMVQRCTNPNAIGWKHYGAIGIKVCDRWLNSFEAFLADMGERPENTSLGRFLDSGNYESGNCTWQSPREQGIQKRVHHRLQFLAA